MKIEHISLPSVFFFKLRIRVGRSFLLCSNDPIFLIDKNWILEIGSHKWAFGPGSNVELFYDMFDINQISLEWTIILKMVDHDPLRY